jgi:hypothetical protein
MMVVQLFDLQMMLCVMCHFVSQTYNDLQQGAQATYLWIWRWSGKVEGSSQFKFCYKRESLKEVHAFW